MNAAQTPLLSNGQQTFSRAALDAEVLALAKVLREQGTRVLATLMDNSPAWVVADLAPLDIRRHLCALPLAVLLENVAGLMAPLAHGAECVVLPLQEVGLVGSSSFDPARLQAAVVRHQPHSMILLPQMLRAWAAWLAHTGERAPASLRMVAVGGASVGTPLVQAARAVGIPAYEGYGLSEGASVQTLNLPWADCPGSAGQPLPHARVRVNSEGEIEVAGSLFRGYLGDAAAPPAWWPTGDLGHIDADGYAWIMSRIDDIINVAGHRLSTGAMEEALSGLLNLGDRK